jgi:CheY-like chemotaxis protein
MTIRTRQAGGMIRLSVADNGPGVPEHISARVFEPFFTTKEVGAGTGLGLSIVHSVMTDHGGRVFHEATLGGGATFVLEFPVVDGPPAGAASAPEEGASRATSISGARVLILDDEPSITELLGEMLGMLGCQTSLASSAPKALELMQAGHFDVILSDFRMPMMNGQAFYEEVQRRRPELAARIIFISGDVINDETQGFLQSTGNLHLTKPFNLQAVEDAVSSVLRRDLPASGSSGSSG